MMKGSASLVLRYVTQRGAALTRVDSARVVSSYRVLSTSALPHSDNGNLHDHHESEKMMSEGGGSITTFAEKKDEVKTKGVSDANQPSKSEWQETKDAVADVSGRAKDKLSEAKDTASESASMASNTAKDVSGNASEAASEKAGEAKTVMDKVSEQAKKEVNTSADMMKDIPQKVSETTQELKEVGVEAAKAVKRDASRAAEKIGLKNPS